MIFFPTSINNLTKNTWQGRKNVFISRFFSNNYQKINIFAVYKKPQDSKHMGYNIRSSYPPVQPAVMSTDGEVSYIELTPNVQLQDFIFVIGA